MVIKLKDESKKGTIFANVAKLKDERDKGGKKFFLNNQLPEPINEQRKRYNQLIFENKR